MSMNQLAQNPSHTWTWEPAIMNSHHYRNGNGHVIREHMFEKPLTPSDVGKLNRLVIPKQNAEKYFPLDSESGEKGLLLSFEDESGKAWKFRYSYWTSSQSYVLTKGWSRYVKEKKLDAGDIVFFERYRAGGADSILYIGCRRRASDDSNAAAAATAAAAAAAACRHNAATAMSWSPYAATPYMYMNSVSGGEQAGGGTATGSTKRRLRLFGVNLECDQDDEPELPQHLVPGAWSTQFMPTNASTSQL